MPNTGKLFEGEQTPAAGKKNPLPSRPPGAVGRLISYGPFYCGARPATKSNMARCAPLGRGGDGGQPFVSGCRFNRTCQQGRPPNMFPSRGVTAKERQKFVSKPFSVRGQEPLRVPGMGATPTATHFSSWPKCEVPTWSGNVCCWGQTGPAVDITKPTRLTQSGIGLAELRA
jgi:hypothetical protein